MIGRTPAAVITGILVILIVNTHACFIRNCPAGGKRTVDEFIVHGTHGCMSCGPDGTGQCYGENICCGPFGCHMGTADALECKKENDSLSPCEVSGKPCGSEGQGNCAAEGICCDSIACSGNHNCHAQVIKKNSKPLNKELLKLLERIIQENREDK